MVSNYLSHILNKMLKNHNICDNIILLILTAIKAATHTLDSQCQWDSMDTILLYYHDNKIHNIAKTIERLLQDNTRPFAIRIWYFCLFDPLMLAFGLHANNLWLILCKYRPISISEFVWTEIYVGSSLCNIYASLSSDPCITSDHVSQIAQVCQSGTTRNVNEHKTILFKGKNTSITNSLFQ